jgi:hypothetical protein
MRSAPAISGYPEVASSGTLRIICYPQLHSSCWMSRRSCRSPRVGVSIGIGSSAKPSCDTNLKKSIRSPPRIKLPDAEIADGMLKVTPLTNAVPEEAEALMRQAYFSRAAKQRGAPRVITLDGYAASHRAVDKLKTSGVLPRRVQVRSCKYLNNVIEQDHRRIKQRVRPMLGFKGFETAAVTIRGIELGSVTK